MRLGAFGYPYPRAENGAAWEGDRNVVETLERPRTLDHSHGAAACVRRHVACDTSVPSCTRGDLDRKAQATLLADRERFV